VSEKRASPDASSVGAIYAFVHHTLKEVKVLAHKGLGDRVLKFSLTTDGIANGLPGTETEGVSV